MESGSRWSVWKSRSLQRSWICFLFFHSRRAMVILKVWCVCQIICIAGDVQRQNKLWDLTMSRSLFPFFFIFPINSSILPSKFRVLVTGTVATCCVYLKNNSWHNVRRWIIFEVLIFQNSWEKFRNEPLNDNLFCCFAVGLVFLGPFSSVFNVYIFATTLVIIFSRAPQNRTPEHHALLFTNSVCCFHTSKLRASWTSIHCQRPLQKHVNHTMLMV